MRIALLLLASCAAQAQEEPALHAWPAFRGAGAGVAPPQDAPLTWNGKTLQNVLWKVAVPKPGTNSPVVLGRRVFVSGSDDEGALEVFAYDVPTGRFVWRQPVKSTASKLPKVMEGTGFSPSTLAVDGERVYAIFATGDLAAFTLDGKPAWTVSLGLPRIEYGYTSSLVTWGGKVFVQFDHDKLGEAEAGRVLAFDAKTGAKVWEQKRPVEMAWSSPILVNTGARWELILNSEPLVTSLDPQTGKLLWSFKCMDGEVTPSPAWGAGLVFVATDRAALVAIRPGDPPQKAWEYEEDLPDVSSPVATDRFVIMASSGGTVTCLEAKSGKVAWKHQFKEGFFGSPVVVGDRVYLMDRGGVTHVFRAGEKFEALATNDLGEKGDCTPAFAGGRIFLRGEKHLFAVGKPAK